MEESKVAPPHSVYGVKMPGLSCKLQCVWEGQSLESECLTHSHLVRRCEEMPPGWYNTRDMRGEEWYKEKLKAVSLDQQWPLFPCSDVSQ